MTAPLYTYRQPPETHVLDKADIAKAFHEGQRRKLENSFNHPVYEYKIHDKPYVFKFLNDRQAFEHSWNSEMFRYAGLPINNYRTFRFLQHELKGAHKDITGVYAPFTEGEGLGPVDGGFYATSLLAADMMCQNIAGVCGSVYSDVYGKNILATQQNELLMIDPEYGAFNHFFFKYHSPVKCIRHADFGWIEYYLPLHAAEGNDGTFERIIKGYQLENRREEVAKSAMHGSAALIAKLQSDPPCLPGKFANAKCLMLGMSLHTYHTASGKPMPPEMLSLQ